MNVERQGASVGRRVRRQCASLGSLRHLSGRVEQAVGLGLRTVILAKDVAFGKLERILKTANPNPLTFIFKIFHLLDHQFIVKGYNSGAEGKEWGKGRNICVLSAPSLPHLHLFTSPEADPSIYFLTP